MLHELLQALTAHARQRGWTDREWAAAASLRPETLSRVRSRGSCDAATLDALTRACGLELAARDPATAAAGIDPTGLFPAQFDRDLEARLLDLCASGDVEPAHWRTLGPPFFMAGVAAMLSCLDDLDPDRRYAALAEALHPGVLTHDAFRLWLRRSPVTPGRFLPMLRKRRAHCVPPPVPALGAR